MPQDQRNDQPRSDISDRLGDLLAGADKGNSEATVQLRHVLDTDAALWHAAGDLARHAERAQIDLAAGDDTVLREALVRRLVEMKAELAGPDPSPLERLLVDRIAICWLQAAYADAQSAQAKEISLKQAEFCHKRADQAHRRYLGAIKALAQVRKLVGESERDAHACSIGGGDGSHGDLEGQDQQLGRGKRGAEHDTEVEDA